MFLDRIKHCCQDSTRKFDKAKISTISRYTTTASGEDDIILTIADAEDLTELLAEKRHKWEEIAMAVT